SLRPLRTSPPKRTELSFDRPLTKPITGIAGCCARAASGHAAAAPPTSVMNSRRLIVAPRGSKPRTASSHSRPGLGTGRGGRGLRPIVLGWQCRLWVPRPASKPERFAPESRPTSRSQNYSRRRLFANARGWLLLAEQRKWIDRQRSTVRDEEND